MNAGSSLHQQVSKRNQILFGSHRAVPGYDGVEIQLQHIVEGLGPLDNAAARRIVVVEAPE